MDHLQFDQYRTINDLLNTQGVYLTLGVQAEGFNR